MSGHQVTAEQRAAWDYHFPGLRARAWRVAKYFRSRGCPISCDDLVQEAMISLWMFLPRFDSTRGAKFSTVAWPRVKSAMIDHMRMYTAQKHGGRGKGKAFVISYEIREHHKIELPEPDRDSFEELTAGMNPKTAEIARLRYVEGMKIDELAKDRGISKSWVEHHLRRAESFVREKIQRQKNAG